MKKKEKEKDLTKSFPSVKRNKWRERTYREDSRLGDEAIAEVDIARGEGDVALATISVAFVPDNTYIDSGTKKQTNTY